MATTPSTQAVLPETAPVVETPVKAAIVKPVRKSKPVADAVKQPVKAAVKEVVVPAATVVKAAAKPVAKAVAKPAAKRPAKASVKPAAAPSAKTPVKTPAKAAAATKASKVVAEIAKQDKLAKAKKPKLVRDSFTIPKPEYLVLDELKQRATKLAYPVKKTELIRAGIKALAAMSDAAYLAAIKAVPVIKTGRPAGI